MQVFARAIFFYSMNIFSPASTCSAIPAAPSVFRLRLRWSNVYILGDDNFIVIDAGTARDKIPLSRILQRHFSSRRCAEIWLTHAHPDHAGSAAFLTRRLKTTVAAHKSEQPFLERRQLYGADNWMQKFVFGLGALIWPVRSVRIHHALHDGEVLPTAAGDWRVIHTPGHTHGHVAFFRERDRVLIAGDAVLTILPWTRRTGLTLPLRIFTRDAEQSHASLRKLAALEPRVLLCGHGEPLLNAAKQLHNLAMH